jgi:hypothetical protein
MLKFFSDKESNRMSRNWWSFSVRVLPILFVAMSVSHPAHAFWLFPFWPFTPPPPPHIYNSPVAAPEYDLRLAIEGLAVAGAAGALIWERIRRRR